MTNPITIIIDAEALALAIAANTPQAVDSVESAAPEPEPLWKISQVAAYFAVTEETANRYAKQPDFPAPMVIGQRRWKADEIMAWAESRRAAKVRR